MAHPNHSIYGTVSVDAQTKLWANNLAGFLDVEVLDQSPINTSSIYDHLNLQDG